MVKIYTTLQKPRLEDVIRYVLNYAPLTQWNAFEWASTYEDDRIVIDGIWNIEHSHRDRIYLHIKMGAGSEALTGFGMQPKLKQPYTLVYYLERGLIRFYRPGYWINHIVQIHKELTLKEQELESLNEQVIDDKALFSEYIKE